MSLTQSTAAADQQNQTPADWLEFSIQVGELSAEAVETAFENCGASAVTFADGADQPIFEPPLGTTPLWDNTIITGLFPGDTDATLIRKLLKSELGELGSQLQIKALADEPWERSWLEHFEPIRFGERLWIVPSAYEPPEPDAVNVLLDPGLAFGTGTHPTTALCLEWLDNNASLLTNKSIIDYGTGSGVLAIAAALLGAKKIIGTDIDTQALEATRDNAERNQVSGKIDLQLVGNDAPSEPVKADCLLANILAGPLAELAPSLCKMTDGPIVLSGILAEQLDTVSAAYQAQGMQETSRRTSGDWGLLAFNE